MKPLFTLRLWAVIGLFLLANQPTKAADKSTVLYRLNNYQYESCSSTVEQLQKKYGAQYALPPDFAHTLDQLKTNKTTLITKATAGDAKALKEAEQLLNNLDALLLSNPLIVDKKIVSIKRFLGANARSLMGDGIGVGPSNFQNNSEIYKPKEHWTNEFVVHKTEKGKVGQPKSLLKPHPGVILSDPEPHPDGKRLLYSSIGTNDRWHLFELNAETGETKQVTPESYKDFDSFDGCYTPDGRYIFCSTATFLGLPCTDGGNKMCGLFIYDPKTDQTRQLTYDQDSNWGPTVLNNGQILYQRWEYADLPHSNSRLLFVMNPDGTGQQMYYGTNSYFPTSFFGARALPDHPTAFVGVATGHHSVARSGRMMILDPAKGRAEAEGVVMEIPYKNRKVEPIVRDRLPDGIYPQFLTPFPVSNDYFLVSIKPTPTSLWGLYLVDTNGNISLVAEDEQHAYIEPIVMEPKQAAPVIPDRIKPGEETATIYMQDIYVGDGLKGIPRGTVKKLRIGSYGFSPWGQGGLLGTVGMDGPWDIKRILGTVNVEEDGSAMFKVPANTPIFVQPLDAEGKALQMMRSWFTAMPGETQSCIGCHESKNTIPVPRANMASKKKPQEIGEWHGKARGFSYRHEIQPILDKRCVACHDGTKENRPYLKGDKWIKDWSSQISGAASAEMGGHFTESYAQLHRYVRRPGIESDMRMLVPMDVHADQTELMQLLQKQHHGVTLDKDEIERIACWIDFNAPFHGRRSDISTFNKTLQSAQLKKQYAPMLCAPLVDLEWLPELDETQTPLRPEKQTPDKGIDSIPGWPLYHPQQTPYVSRYAPQNKQLNLGYYQETIPLDHNTSVQLIKVPAGEFVMGSTNAPDEMPRSKVTIETPFWIGRYEITNAQYKAFDPTHESRDEHRHGYQFGRRGYSMDAADQPVVRVSWEDAMAFCEWLSKKTGKKVTLPTEAQWEWACRAGSDTPFWFGNLSANFSRYANLGDIKLKEFAACTAYKNYESTRIIENPNRYDDWIPRDTTYNDGGFISEPVGRYIANSWDLADMHGNVWEWTRSEYKPYPYADQDGRNNTETKNVKRVARGGSWYDRPKRATSSYRLPYRNYQKVFNVGFRVVIEE